MDDRSRGPRLAAHLAARERPGEVVVATGLLGCCSLPIALAGIVVLGAVLGGKLPSSALILPGQAAFLGFCILALWRGAR